MGGLTARAGGERPRPDGAESPRPWAIRAWAAALALLAAGCATWPPATASRFGWRRTDDGDLVRLPSGRSVYVELRRCNTELPQCNTEPPVLLIHGFASNHDVWDRVEPALRQTRTTINVDLPGFGRSDRRPGDYSPDALAADVLSVLDGARVAQVDVVAHSWGSSVALALALRARSRVRRIVLVGAWVYDAQIPPLFRWAQLPGVGEAIFGAFWGERADDRAALGFASETMVTQGMVDDVERYLEGEGASRAALAAVRGQCFLQLERRYPTVRHPTLLVWGDGDRVSRLRFGERLARELPDARLEVVRGAAHFPMLERAAATRALLVDFLGAGTARAVGSGVAASSRAIGQPTSEPGTSDPTGALPSADGVTSSPTGDPAPSTEGP